MSTLRALALVGVAALIAACAHAPVQQPALMERPDLSGAWILTTESAMGVQNSDMQITQTGAALAGTLTSPMGGVDFTGSVDGAAVAFGFMLNAQGAELRVDYDGVIEGDAMKGKANFGAFGEGSFRARRKEEADSG
ncbi:MAG: hypothetical protein RBS02_03480 [Steroidobacteraceae bacterium]|nr:hypothetical protein [Steroidobacteraceae bacterium]